MNHYVYTYYNVLRIAPVPGVYNGITRLRWIRSGGVRGPSAVTFVFRTEVYPFCPRGRPRCHLYAQRY